MASYDKEGDKVASKPSSPAPKLSDPSVINSINVPSQVGFNLSSCNVTVNIIKQ